VSDAWRPVLSGHDAERALEVAREVGMRLADPARLARAIETTPHESASPELAEWHSIGLAQGHPGLALAFAQLDACFPGEGWGDAAHRQLELTVEALRADRHAASGLFSGLAGIAFAARSIDAVR
jgi:hypothetical protein